MTQKTEVKKIMVTLQGNPSLNASAQPGAGVWVKLFYSKSLFPFSKVNIFSIRIYPTSMIIPLL